MSKKPKLTAAPRPSTSIDYISVAGLTELTSPVGLHLYATDFLAAAKNAPQMNALFAPAKTHLVCRSLELILKAFLCLRGFASGSLLAGGYGHNLGNILAEAEKHGLLKWVSLSREELDAMRWASKYYEAKVFEYPAMLEAMKGYPENPNLTLLFSAAETLVAAVGHDCLDAK